MRQTPCAHAPAARSTPAAPPSRPVWLVALIAALLVAGSAKGASAQTGANVLLVVNEKSAESVRIGEHYARVRGVPADQVVKLAVPIEDEIGRAAFEQQIELPVSRAIGRTGAYDRILYIVLTKGVPLRVQGSTGRSGTVASVDSELALLYRKMLGVPVPPAGPLPNPYYLGKRPIQQARRFRHADYDIYLVTRLDGYTEADVIGMIDRAMQPTDAGRFVLDGKAGWNETGNDWLRAAAAVLTTHGMADRVVLDATSAVLSPIRDVLGYYSWGSNDPAVTTRRPDVTFVPGAIGGTYVSTDGRTFSEPPDDWTIGTWQNRASFFANSPQSLVGDLIRAGITGVAGHVAEPYLDATIRPNVLFPAYVSAFNLAESFYLAMPYLSWQTVVVGDPLCSPFPRKPLEAVEIDKGIDPATEFPAIFGARRLKLAQAASAIGLKVEGLRAGMKADARMARDDRDGARQALEEATAAEPRMTTAQLGLATIYEGAGEYDRAIARYRVVLEQSPTNVVALNNLAYALAVRKGRPADALALAEKAWALAPGSPNIADTLAWVQHLTGNQGEALKLLRGAVRAAPGAAEMRYHLAAVLLATGDEGAARDALVKAIELAPALSEREDVRALKEKLGVK